MKGKTGMLVAAIAAVLLLGIGGFVYFTNLKAKPSNDAEKTTEKSSTGGMMFSSIQDAIAKNLTLQCNFTDSSEVVTATYLKNGMIRANVTSKTPDSSGTVIMRDGKMYFWNDKSAITISFDMKEIEKDASENAPAGQNPQNYMAMMEKYRESCKPATVDDSLFVIPTNVKFQDLSEMMKGLQNGAGSNSTGAGTAAPSINPSDYQKLIDQYQNQD